MVPLFVFDDDLLRTWHRSPNRLGFLLESLTDLDRGLRGVGGALVVRRGDWVREVLRVASDVDAWRVHVASDVSGFAQRRIARLQMSAAGERVDVQTHDTVTVVAPGAIRPASGGPFLVFTPYWRRWRDAQWRPLAPPVRAITLPPGIAPGTVPLLADLTTSARAPEVIEGGEQPALARLKRWTPTGVSAYPEVRDDLAADATSHLSAPLHFGCVSPAEVASRLRAREGAEAFVRQLCWRDFFSQLLARRPDTAHDDLRGGPRRWVTDHDAVAAWKQGRTGFPVVDAAMRQLLHEGWMHNRARMVVASFLTKDLLVDWRVGAAHFMAHLVDGDVAVNQLSWQWVAGTGTDTNPHRVYNPTVQGRRHDPSGAYVRRYVAELADVQGDVHDLDPAARRRVGYPAPLVDHREAIEAWRAARVRGSEV